MPSLNDLKVVISTQADTKGVKDTEDSLGGLSTKTAAIFGAMAGAAQNVVNQGINFITSSVGDAIGRVDTLNNSNRTFENMGFSAGETKKIMGELDQSIRGLPTRLNDAVSGVELLTGSTNDIGKSRQIFDALNDGVIGFGGSASMVNGTVVQLSQAFSNGRVDAQTWNSMIQNGMGPALNALARQMGITTGQLKDGLSTGQISVGQFQDALINLDTKGGGGMKSLNQIAHDSTSGIGTGIDNAKTAVTRGIADIIKSIGSENISNAISAIGKAFESLGKDIANFVSSKEFKNWMHEAGDAIKIVIDDIKEAIKYYNEHKRVINDVIQVIGALVLAFYTIQVVVGIINAVKNAWIILQAVMALNPIMLAIMVIIAIIILLALHWGEVTEFMKKAWHEVAAFFSQIWNDIIGFFKRNADMILAILLGPIGIIIGHWGEITRFFGNLWGMLSGGFSSAYNGMVNWARNVVNDIVSFFSGLPGRVAGAVGNIAGSIAGDIKGAFHGLHIPGFATGVTNFSGGMALVGENGPELVSLPRGSSVYTNGQSKGMAGGNSSHTETNIYGDIHLGDASAVETFFAKIDQDTKLASRGMTGNRGIR